MLVYKFYQFFQLMEILLIIQHHIFYFHLTYFKYDLGIFYLKMIGFMFVIMDLIYLNF